MTGGAVGVGFVGTGMISDTYLANLTSFPDVRVVILGDIDTARAAAQARKHGIAESGTPEDVLAHPDVELVVNLTVPAAHVPVSLAAIAAGKHVWSEKPIGIDRAAALGLLAQAEAAGLRVGIAPDTVLGPGLQTARRAIARGDIGVPLSAQTSMQYAGPDIFHPNPEFLFAKGAGPLIDMGPYYVTALVTVFGPVARVAAVGSKGREVRTVRVGERAGAEFPVEVPTLVQAIAQFEQGATSQSVFSFDSPLARTGVVEVTGTEGTMIIPDPNTFGGEVRITRAPAPETAAAEPAWEVVPPVGVEAGRGLGVLDMARAIRAGVCPTSPRASSAITSSTPCSRSRSPSPPAPSSRCRARSARSRSSPRTATRSRRRCRRRRMSANLSGAGLRAGFLGGGFMAAVHSRAALAAGRHVVCEKPLATTVADARAVVAAADAAGLVGAVPFVYRYHPIVRQARALVAAGELGTILTIDGAYLQDWMQRPGETNWRADAAAGGASRAFADIGSHLCDLLEFVTGRRIVALTARTRTVYPQRRGAEVANEDIAAIVAELDDGALATLLVTQLAPGRKNGLVLEVHGTEQSLRFAQERPEELWIGSAEGSRLVLRDPAAEGDRGLSLVPAGHPMGYQDAFNAFVADVYAAVRGEDPDGLPTFADGLRAAVITAAVLESATTGAWARIESIPEES